MKKELWSFLIDGVVDAENGQFANLYAYGDHLGDAIANARAAAESLGYTDIVVVEAGKADLDPTKEKDLKAVGEHAYMQPDTFSYPVEEDDRDIMLPTGIIKADQDGELDLDEIMEGFAAYDQNKKGEYTLDLVVAAARAEETLMSLVGKLPTVTELRIEVKSHWEKQKEDVLLSLKTSDKDKVAALLQETRVDTLHNGFIDCAVLTADTVLTYDEHKMIRLATTNKKLFDNCLDALYKMGYEYIDDLCSIDEGFYHWHYRAAGSLERGAFLDMLKEKGFEIVAITEAE